MKNEKGENGNMKNMKVDPAHTFVTSDHHFCSFGCLLKRTTEEEDAQHVATWNEVVGKDDLVLYVGDFADTRAIKDLMELRKNLNGRIVLIKGNHDENLNNHDITDEYLKLIFEDVVDGIVLEDLGVQLMHSPNSSLRRPEMKLIHGHTHTQIEEYPTVTSTSFCCCACRHDWKPVRLLDALKAMELVSARDEEV